MTLTAEQISEIEEILSPYIDNELVVSQKKNIQHGTTTMYEHCMNVVKMSMWLDGKSRIKTDHKSMVTGAFLHDFFLYDWHTDNPDGWGHSYMHPVRACENAIKEFDIDRRTQIVILSHMWPVAPSRFPITREARLVCIADKFCSLMETMKKEINI